MNTDYKIKQAATENKNKLIYSYGDQITVVLKSVRSLKNSILAQYFGKQCELVL